MADRISNITLSLLSPPDLGHSIPHSHDAQKQQTSLLLTPSARGLIFLRHLVSLPGKRVASTEREGEIAVITSHCCRRGAKHHSSIATSDTSSSIPEKHTDRAVQHMEPPARQPFRSGHQGRELCTRASCARALWLRQEGKQTLQTRNKGKEYC